MPETPPPPALLAAARRELGCLSPLAGSAHLPGRERAQDKLARVRTRLPAGLRRPHSPGAKCHRLQEGAAGGLPTSLEAPEG